MDYLKTLGVAPLAADAIRAITQGAPSAVNALLLGRRGEAAIRRAAAAELRELIERIALSRALEDLGPQSLVFPYLPRDPYVPPPPRAAAKRLALEDAQRGLSPPTTPQRRGREQEMPEVVAPKAKQRVITEQEILAEAKHKATPLKISAPEILATQTSKAASPKAQDILATHTSKAKPKGAPRLEDRQPFDISPNFAASTALYTTSSLEELI